MLRVEAGVLLAFAFVLPLFEAPKNLLWLVFVAIWLANRFRGRDFGGRWDRWDTLIVLWIASGFAAAAFAGLHDDEWRAAADIVRYATVAWLLKRSRYPDRTWTGLALAILAGTVVALAWGYAALPRTHLQLQMNSVGHVNHSAIYLAIVLGLALAATRAWWSSWGWGRRAGALALLAAFALSLQWMESRGAIGAAFVMSAALLGVEALRQRRPLRTTVLVVLAAAAAVLLATPAFIEKNLRFMEAGKFLNVRDGVWRVGFYAWREYPAFGVGMDNFHRIRPENVREWNAKHGEPFEPEALLFTSHGHSLYVTALAERGLVGLGMLLAVLVAWAAFLVRSTPGAGAPPLHWTYWGGAAAAWIVSVLVGLVNTTLHHEHALLAMLLLGGWLSLGRRAA
jgi:O-antigen ligase